MVQATRDITRAPHKSTSAVGPSHRLSAARRRARARLNRRAQRARHYGFRAMVKRTAALLAAILAATPATAGQYLAPGPGGFRYAPPARAPWLNGYVRPYRPNPGVIIGGAIAGALAAVPRPVLPVQPPPDAMDEIAPVNAQGVTRQEVEEAIADFCSRNATASLCVKLQSR
jgi:hypothetical protein